MRLAKLDKSKRQRLADMSLRSALASLAVPRNPGTLRSHPARTCLPDIVGPHWELFCDSIMAHGLISPIVICDGMVLGGWRRLRACLETGTEPQFIEAEQSVLGAALLDDGALDRINGNVSAADFYLDSHRMIYEHARNLHDDGKPVDVTTLQSKLEDADKLAYVGGMSYLGTLLENVPTAANARHYADIVRHKAEVRRIAAAGATTTEQTTIPGADPASILGDAVGQFDALAADGAASRYDFLDYEHARLRSDLFAHVPKSFPFIVHGILPQAPGIINGTGDVGKTRFVLWMSICIALGRPFLASASGSASRSTWRVARSALRPNAPEQGRGRSRQQRRSHCVDGVDEVRHIVRAHWPAIRSLGVNHPSLRGAKDDDEIVDRHSVSLAAENGHRVVVADADLAQTAILLERVARLGEMQTFDAAGLARDLRASVAVVSRPSSPSMKQRFRRDERAHPADSIGLQHAVQRCLITFAG
jgi:hypothetical protein